MKSAAKVINFRYRNIKMMKNDLILRNPLRILGNETDDILAPGQFGAVLAHAGTGKTALLVQLALNAMLRNRKVIHVSLGDPVHKIDLSYQELFQDLAKQHEVPQINQLWESIQPNRFIMTFKAISFSVPKLAERINDLTAQNIFIPQMLIIDGFHFGESGREPIVELKELAKLNGVYIWFTVHTHRHLPPGPDGMPVSLLHLADLFDLVLQLEAKGSEIYIQPLKGGVPAAASSLRLDPETMLIKG